MPVKYILAQAGSKMGLNPSAASSRATLLRFLNEAAIELYDQSDPAGSLMEQVFKVNGDQTISCPSCVGSIRGVREINTRIAWSINQMRPRYNQFNWVDNWRNIRLKNTQALMSTVTNASLGVLTVPVVETPSIEVTVSGPTPTATMASETVIMTSTSMQTLNTYTDYTSVKKNAINKYDITLSDVDGKVLTIIPNNQLSAQYQIIDISQCPWLALSSSTLDHYVEILYKQALTWLSNDSDEFVFGPKYANILVNKMIQLWYEEQGKPNLAMAFDAKATRSLARKHEDANRATEDMIATVAHPHDALLARVRSGRFRYYRGYGARGYG